MTNYTGLWRLLFPRADAAVVITSAYLGTAAVRPRGREARLSHLITRYTCVTSHATYYYVSNITALSL